MPMMLGQQSGGRNFRARFLVMASLMTLALLILLGRLYYLQVIRGDDYKEKSIDNFVKETRVPADRGMILDHHGRILVDSRPSYNVTLTPAFCQLGRTRGKEYCLKEVIPRLATYLSLSEEETERVVKQYLSSRGLSRFRDFIVKIDVDLDALDRVDANRIFDLPGVDYVAAPHRRYLYQTMAAHVLGYMNEITADELDTYSRQGVSGYQIGDYVGRRGVERRFEQELKGQDGSIKIAVDAKGRKRPDSDHLLKEVNRGAPAKSGNNVVLSLNLPLQQAAEKAFESARAGAIVVVDVHTGFLLAVVSKPAYDPNKLTGRISSAELEAIRDDPLQPLIFRVAQQHYHPGSTFKPITALAGLEEATVNASSTAFCGGGYSLGKRRWRCHKDSGHGTVDLHHALSWSCDTYFYQLSDRMGIEPIAQMSRKFGLGKSPGLDLSPEAPGVVPSMEYHDRVTPGGYTKGLALNTSIGQGDNNLSPLQLVMVYAAIANGGTLYRPQIVRRIEDGDGHLVRAIEPVVVNKLDVKPRNLALVVDGLKAVVNEPGGTAFGKKPKNLDVVIAGKTGTAQVVAIGEKRLKEEQMTFFARDHAWFAAFAPADKAEIAVVVLNEHGGHGGSASAPAGMDIIAAYYRIKAEEEAARNGPPPSPANPPRKNSPSTPSPTPETARPREARRTALPRVPEQKFWN